MSVHEDQVKALQYIINDSGPYGHCYTNKEYRELEARVAALREELESYPFKHHNNVCGCPECQWLSKRVELLSSPDPGEKIMRVVEAARRLKTAIQKSYDCTHYNEKATCANEMDSAEKDLWQALADMEGGGR